MEWEPDYSKQYVVATLNIVSLSLADAFLARKIYDDLYNTIDCAVDMVTNLTTQLHETMQTPGPVSPDDQTFFTSIYQAIAAHVLEHFSAHNNSVQRLSDLNNLFRKFFDHVAEEQLLEGFGALDLSVDAIDSLVNNIRKMTVGS